MSTDLIAWVIRAVIIAVAIILASVIWKGRKAGRYQEYSLRFFTIGTTAFVMGIILLIVSSVTGMSFEYDLFLTAAGAIIIIIGLVIRNLYEKKR